MTFNQPSTRSGGMSIFFNPQEVKDEPRRDNNDFFRKEKADQNIYPETMIKQRDNTHYDETDFLPTPLLGPNIHRREDNHVKLWIEQKVHVQTK